MLNNALAMQTFNDSSTLFATENIILTFSSVC